MWRGWQTNRSRSTVCCSSDRRSWMRDRRNLGVPDRLTGHRRVPHPPAGTTIQKLSVLAGICREIRVPARTRRTALDGSGGTYFVAVMVRSPQSSQMRERVMTLVSASPRLWLVRIEPLTAAMQSWSCRILTRRGREQDDREASHDLMLEANGSLRRTSCFELHAPDSKAAERTFGFWSQA